MWRACSGNVLARACTLPSCLSCQHSLLTCSTCVSLPRRNVLDGVLSVGCRNHSSTAPLCSHAALMRKYLAFQLRRKPLRYVRGYVGTWVRGCVGVWVSGCVGACVRAPSIPPGGLLVQPALHAALHAALASSAWPVQSLLRGRPRTCSRVLLSTNLSLLSRLRLADRPGQPVGRVRIHLRAAARGAAAQPNLVIGLRCVHDWQLVSPRARPCRPWPRNGACEKVRTSRMGRCMSRPTRPVSPTPEGGSPSGRPEESGTDDLLVCGWDYIQQILPDHLGREEAWWGDRGRLRDA